MWGRLTFQKVPVSMGIVRSFDNTSAVHFAANSQSMIRGLFIQWEMAMAGILCMAASRTAAQVPDI